MKERLFKKNVLNKTTVEHVSWTCCSMFHLQCMLHSSSVVHSKKRNQWDLFRVTFPFKHVVGGREAHKIVGVEFSIFPPNFVSHPFSSPILWMGRSDVWGEDPMFGSNHMVGCPPIRNINGWFQIDETLDIKLCPIEFPNLLHEKRSELHNGSC